MERLNSLFEDDPSLHLYEHSEGEVLTRARGTIHPSFRLFATSNPGRVSANKMSSALLNRIVRICLLPLDTGLTRANILEHDIYRIVAHNLQGVRGGYELASLCIGFHAEAVELFTAGELQLLSDYQLTARSLFYVTQSALQYMRSRSCSPVNAVMEALIKTYLPGLVNQEQQQKLLAAAAAALKEPQLQKLVYEQPPIPVASGSDAWQEQSLKLGSKLAQVEELVATIAWNLVPLVPVVSVATSYAQEVSICLCPSA